MINQAMTISGYLYGSWNSIDGVVVGVPVEVRTNWGFTATATTWKDGKFTINTNCPPKGGTYDVTVDFNGDTYLMGSSGTISYRIIEYIETTLTLTHRFESSGMGGARRFYGYLRERVSGLPVPNKTVRLTIYSGGYAFIFDITTNSQGYYDYLFTGNSGIFTWAEARFAGSGLYLASFSGRIYP